MRVNQKIKILIICLITMLLCCGISFFNIYTVNAESSLNIENYTNSNYFEHNNSTYNIENYLGNLYEPYNLTNSELSGLYGNTIKDSDYGVMASGDDPVVGIVPKELFKKPNEQYTFMGEEYGFFIKTQMEDNYVLSNVIVYDIINNHDLQSNKSHMKFGVKVLFQREYMYVANAGDYILKTRSFRPKVPGERVIYELSEKINSTFVLHTQQSDLVMPMPYVLDGNTLVLCDSQRYIVQDIVSTVAIFNEQHLNDEDEGYSPINDKGKFITQIDGAYQATVYDVNEKSFWWELFKTTLIAGVCDGLEYGLEKLGYGALWGLGEFAVDAYNAYMETADRIEQLTRNFTYKSNGTTSQEQIENTGRLAKFGLSTLEFFNDGQFGEGSYMFYDEGDFYEADYQVGYTPELDEYNQYKTPWEARLVRGFSIKFVNSNNRNEYVTSSGVADFLIKNNNNEEYLDLDYVKTTEKVSILPGGQNLFLFVPLHTGKYKLTTNGANAPVKISVYKIIGGSSVYYQHLRNANDNDRIFDVEIKMGCGYVFKVEYEDKTQQGNFDITLEFIPQEINWGEYTVYVDDLHSYYRIYSSQNAYLDLKLSNENWGYSLFDKNLKQIYNNSLNKDEYYYIRIARHNSNTGYVKLRTSSYINLELKNIENITEYLNPNFKFYFNSELMLPKPTKNGYTFEGWWTSIYDFGELVTDNIVRELEVRDITLYAKWKAIEYNVKYVTNGGSGIEIGTYITDNSYALRTDTFKDGYVLYGWYDNPEFTGEKIEVLEKGSIGDRVFYARWIQDEFVVTFDLNKGATDNIEANLETKSVFINYNELFKLPIPSIEDYEFDGWFYGEVQITDNMGVSFSKYTFEENIELTAHWTRNKFYICMDDNGQLLWLAKDDEGYFFTTEEFGLLKEDGMCPGCYIKYQLETYKDSEYSKAIREKLFKAGHIYLTMALEPKDIIIDNEFDEDLCCWKTMNFIQNNKNKVINIYPVYALEKYTVMFDMDNDSKNIITKIVYYGEDMTKFETPTKLGYTFANWIVKSFANYEIDYGYVANNFPAGFIFPSKMPDLTAGIENFVQPSIMLAPQYTSNEYIVSFAGENVNFSSKNVFYGNSYSNNDKNAFPIPTKTGYAFDGWYSGENGTGNKVVNEYGAIDSWNIPNDCTLYAHYTPMHYQITFDFCGGSSELSTLEVIYDQALPYAVAPTRTGYTFVGYFDNTDGNGTRYYNSEMLGLLSWTNTSNITLYAHWMANNYTVKLNAQGGSGGSTEFTVTFGQPLPSSLSAPTRMGYYFKGYYSDFDGRGTCYLDDYMRPNNNWDIAHDTTLYANWEIRTLSINVRHEYSDGNAFQTLESYTITISGSESKSFVAKVFDSCTFLYWQAHASDSTDISKAPRLRLMEPVNSNNITINFDYFTKLMKYRYLFLCAIYDKNCVAEGTMITLADGSQKAVEDLTGNEQLLVWNLMTGKFDTAPILFIDSDQLHNYQVINLHFSDGTIVKVISEHAFWDFDLNKYVFLRRDADKYIGHWFNKQLTDSDGNMTWGKVQLTDVQIKYETTRAYSPVTYSHLCYYVNGMLSMPGATEGLINIFEVDSETMKIDVEQFNADIEKYGIYTYEEFAKIIPVTEEVFNAFNGMYLKVAIGKGLITIERLQNLVASYFN